MEQDLESLCTDLRNNIRDLGKDVIALKKHSDLDSKIDRDFAGDKGEAIANFILAYRHLEDAGMRIGKVMQQIQGGVSIFDK